MHPALSIILFTTLSGLGFGMFAWLGFGGVTEAAQLATTIIAFVLAAVGLSASTFHLGHPERAWRAFSQWRSSWLSREGVMAVLTLALVFLWWLLDSPDWLGVLMAISALVTVYTTSMIYAQMRSVRQWNTSLTSVVFILLSLAGGGLMCTLVAALSGNISAGPVVTAALMLGASWLAKLAWWRRADSETEISDTASATGLGGDGLVRLLESPHSGSNYLLNEMGFRVGRKHAHKLRRIALLAGGALPLVAAVVALIIQGGTPVMLFIAVLFHLTGVLAERWLFFAEARHAVMSFYD